MLTRYNEYVQERLVTEALTQFPLFLSARLREVLSRIDHEIAKELLNLHSYFDGRSPMTFLDVHDTADNMLTFIQPNKAAEVLGLDINTDEELDELLTDKSIRDRLSQISDDDDVYHSMRSDLRIGRLVTRLFGNKYPNDIGGGQNTRDRNSFINMYKSLYDMEKKVELIDFISGDDIAYWYYCDRYANRGMGSLWESCMMEVPSSYFNLYTGNPDTIQLMVMYKNNRRQKIVARAIVWRLSHPAGKTFMDRVYTTDYSDEQVFIDYAKRNGWFRKSSQSLGNDVPIVNPTNGQSSVIRLVADLSPCDCDEYPYLDTMVYYNPDTGQISNRKVRINPKYRLVSTRGGYDRLSSYTETPEYVHSNFNGEDIMKSDAKYCKFGDDWVYEDQAIRVWNAGPDGPHFAVPGNPDVAESSFGDYSKFFPKDKCVWSDFLNTWLFKWSAVRVWSDIGRTSSILLHKKHHKDSSFREINGEYWSIDLIGENGELVGEPPEKVETPVGNPPEDWDRKEEYIDDDGNIFRRGKYIGRVD